VFETAEVLLSFYHFAKFFPTITRLKMRTSPEIDFLVKCFASGFGCFALVVLCPRCYYILGLLFTKEKDPIVVRLDKESFTVLLIKGFCVATLDREF